MHRSMKEKNSSKERVGGISANVFAFTLLIVVAVLHAIIIILVIDMNNSNDALADLMERSGEYQIEATNVQASNTVLSETCGNYIQMPVTDGGSANFGPLLAYAEEIGSERSGVKVAERFKSYNVSYDVLSAIEEAAELSEQMMRIQIHAISLMDSVYPLPENPRLSSIRLVELTAEELAMTDDERVERAETLVLEKDYATLRNKVAKSIEKCNTTLQEEFSLVSQKTSEHVATVRIFLWIAIFATILILSSAFVMFYFLMVKPLRRYSNEISSNQSIEQTGGIYELRRLVNAFNGLWHHRNKLEAILRKAAEIDALTGLPNRYCMERDLLENSGDGNSMAVLLFDVNFLKKTNDTRGHLMGDQLIRTAGACISESFGAEGANKCYRIGGDEFVVILSGCSEEEVKSRIDRFNLALERENITVSVGYAYAEKTDGDSFKKLMIEADRNMYEQKKQIHKLFKSEKIGE